MDFIRIIESLTRVDRRIIFLLIFLCVLIPLLVGKGEKVDSSPPVVSAFKEMESLKPGDIIMLSIDYDATSAPELQPMIEALLNHAFRKNVKVIMIGQLATGLPLGQIALEQVAAKYNKKYGEDYINLGYRPGGVSVIVSLGRELRDQFNTDYLNIAVDQYPMMKKVHSYKDISVLISLAHGATLDLYVQYANGRFGVKIIGCTTAVSAPAAYVYLNANQLVGLIGGLRGAAEYESLVDVPGTGILGMPAQSATHVLIIVLVALGNLSYFTTLIFKQRKGAAQ